MKILSVTHMERIRQRLLSLYGDVRVPRLMERLALLAARYQLNGRGARKTWDQTDAVLITYGDMIRCREEPPLITLRRFLKGHLRGAIHTVHLLPFFPYSSDEGFSVIDYREVNPELGTWDDVRAIGKDFRLMFDLVLNHASSENQWFKCFQNGVAPARDYFITMDQHADLSAVVRPRTSPLLSPVQTPVGEKWVWTTFSGDQVDLNFANPDVLFEFLDILLFYVEQGAHIIRLDAIAYLWKQTGTPCINLPQTHEVVKLLRDLLDMLVPDSLLLTETNLPHEQNISYFGEGDEAHMVYQFSLAPLLLHALYSGSSRYLMRWASALPQLPRGCTFLNFTASHDGIGVRPLEALVPNEEILQLVEEVRRRGGHVSSRTDAEGSEQPYELNITYFDALSDPDYPDSDLQIARFLCSQTLMLSLQGMPAVYFHSLTASPNDTEAVERTGEARAINRSRWMERALLDRLGDPQSATSRVFHEYVRRLRIRAEHPAFHPDGAQRVLDVEDGLFAIERVAPDATERLYAISNLSSETRWVSFDALTAGTDEQMQAQWMDLISDQAITPEPGGRLMLVPYQTCWLLLPPAKATL